MYDVFDSLVAERPATTAGEGPVELTELLRVLVGSAGHAMATAALVAVADMDADALRLRPSAVSLRRPPHPSLGT